MKKPSIRPRPLGPNRGERTVHRIPVLTGPVARGAYLAVGIPHSYADLPARRQIGLHKAGVICLVISKSALGN